MKNWITPALEELEFNNTACSVCEENLSGDEVIPEDYGRCPCGGQYHQPNQSTDPNPYHKDTNSTHYVDLHQPHWKP